MPLYKGNQEVDMVYLGNQEIAQIYKGNQEVWSNLKIIDLGWGKTWDIKSLFPNLYDKLTVDNFFLLSANSVNGSDRIVGTGRLALASGIAKSYDSSTGILSFYTSYNYGEMTNTIRAVLVNKIDKLTYLGLGTSFNVKNIFPNDYQNMTADNFFVKTIRHWNSDTGLPMYYDYFGNRSVSGTWTASGNFTFHKSYNSSTGVLTVYFNSSGSASGVSDTWNGNSNCYVYASKKRIRQV